jgi:hypothetical protein
MSNIHIIHTIPTIHMMHSYLLLQLARDSLLKLLEREQLAGCKVAPQAHPQLPVDGLNEPGHLLPGQHPTPLKVGRPKQNPRPLKALPSPRPPQGQGLVLPAKVLYSRALEVLQGYRVLLGEGFAEGFEVGGRQRRRF